MYLAVGQDQHSNHNNASSPEKPAQKNTFALTLVVFIMDGEAHSKNWRMIPVLNGRPSLSELIQLMWGKDVK